MKSNIEYLREELSKHFASNSVGYNEINEWVDAIEDELSKVDDLNSEIEDLEMDVRSKDREIDNLERQIAAMPHLETIDCGIGTIQYTADNLKLQCLMDDFKEQHERSKQTLPLFQN